jgi:6-phosphofructokinase
LKTTICSVENCENESVRSLSKDRITDVSEKLGFNLVTARSDRVKRAHLCKEHYKQIKKSLKKKDKYERMRYGR